MILTLLILIQFVFVGADTLHPSCYFNPLCTCSKAVPNLGIVSCVNVPLPRLPIYISRSKINSFWLQNNGLKVIEPQFLSGTGLYMLKISLNPIHVIHDESFKGLEYSLRDLELSYLKLIEVPKKALQSLQKLRSLNLAGNDISDVSSQNWINVRNTLEILILKQNAITFIPRNAFERFSELKYLDLSANALRDMDPDAFFPYTFKLSHLDLSDNQLYYLPYAQLQHLRSLRTLNLEYNFITTINAISESTRIAIQTKFSLNSLHLEYNNIKSLSDEDFQKFIAINRTFFDGNPITMIQFGTFQDVHVHEISFKGCGLVEFHADMVKGLEKYLQILDLSNNDLFSVDTNLFLNFFSLQELRTKGNKISEISIPEYNGALVSVEISGNEHIEQQTLLKDLSRIKSLIRVSITNVEISYLSYDSFIGYGFGMEELAINNAYLRTINTQAFINVRGLKKLDLSNNDIFGIHDNAFAEIGHSLLYLYLSNGFSKEFKIVPNKPLQHLTSLRVLDLSFNRFEELPVNSFYSLHDIEVIRLHDCKIRTLHRETFLADVHVKLKELTFSYNSLDTLKSYSFADLPELQYINLEDNFIKSVETRTFVNLKNLRWLYLRGNKIEAIGQEAFENLPRLEVLDLAYNNLKNFDFIALDQVGTLMSLNLNLSFNDLNFLRTFAPDAESDIYFSNVKVLDISNSRIFDISDEYFIPLESTVTHLHASKNYLVNITQDVFGSLSQLQVMDLSHNMIRTVDTLTFKNLTKLQILNLSRNEIDYLPSTLFNGMKYLRIVDFSNNKLTTLPEFLFHEDSLETVSIAGNKFNKIPFTSFSIDSANSLTEFDVSRNFITSVHSPDHYSRFKSLISLDISNNRLTRIDDSVFSPLSNLRYLDLSHNTPLQLLKSGRSFNGVYETLMSLKLKNISLQDPPDFPLPKLIYLDLSHNNVSSFTPETVVNLTSLRVLDLSENNLTSIPVLILSLRNLKSLNLSTNIIKELTNNSLLSGFEELRELDISHLPLEIFETGALSRLMSLGTLYLSTFFKVERFSICRILEKNTALKDLFVMVTKESLNEQMRGHFPRKLKNIVIRGKRLKYIDSRSFQGITSPQISLILENTDVESLNNDLFWNMPMVRNVSLTVRNNSLKRMSNPSTGNTLDLYNRTFLIDLKLSYNEWNCDCYIGWIETWKRVKRQILCRYIDFTSSKSYHDCLKTEDDLRMAVCANKRSMVLDVMKTELECGFSRSSYNFAVHMQYIVMICLWIFRFNFGME